MWSALNVSLLHLLTNFRVCGIILEIYANDCIKIDLRQEAIS